MRSDGRVVSPDVTFTITPCVPAASIARASAWHDHIVTNRFCSTTSRSASSSRSTNAAGERPDVVDGDVEATELVDHVLHEGTHLVGIAQVGRRGDDARARRGDLH